MFTLKHIVTFFDKLEDRVRISLSHYPVVYSCIGGVGIVLFWKGVWETAEYFPILFGPASILVGVIILLVTGLMVSFFIGDSILISGFKREKKLTEKTEREVRSGKANLQFVVVKLEEIEKKLETLVAQKDVR